MKGFKTVILGVLIAAISALSSPEMQAFVAENFAGVGATLGTLVVIMRALTNSPMFSKGDDKPEGDVS